MEKVFIAKSRFAVESGVGRRKIEELIKIKGFPCMHIGNKTLVNRDAALTWLAEYSEAGRKRA